MIQPFLLATFCDDVREEAGNKVSFMGIYGPNLVVRSFPTTLPKLCCVFNVRIPAKMKPQRTVLRLLRDDLPIFEAEVESAAASEAAARLSMEAADTHAIAFNFVAQLRERCLHQLLWVHVHPPVQAASYFHARRASSRQPGIMTRLRGRRCRS